MKGVTVGYYVHNGGVRGRKCSKNTYKKAKIVGWEGNDGEGVRPERQRRL